MTLLLTLLLPILAQAQGAAWRSYSAQLPEEDQKILAHIASLGAFDPDRAGPYGKVGKKDGILSLEAFVRVPGELQKAIPMAKDFSSYKDWVLQRINERRDGKGRYLVDIQSMEHFKEEGLLKVWVRFNVLFKGRYFLRLRIDDRLSDPLAPYLGLKLNKPTKLAPKGQGYFKLYAPHGSKEFVVYFYGDAKPHWAIYYLLPLSVFQSEAVGRIQAILDNILLRLQHLGALGTPA
ncbi:MAG: hypothetical protein WC728_04625 [Elusimicrobiota bacterium]